MEDTEPHTAIYTWFSKRIHVKLVTHTAFSFYVFLKRRYTASKTLYFASIVEFIAAWPLCWQGSKNGVLSCCTEHKQPHCYACYFCLQISPKWAGQKVSIDYQYYIGYDENNDTKLVKFWKAVLKLACVVSLFSYSFTQAM